MVLLAAARGSPVKTTHTCRRPSAKHPGGMTRDRPGYSEFQPTPTKTAQGLRLVKRIGFR